MLIGTTLDWVRRQIAANEFVSVLELEEKIQRFLAVAAGPRSLKNPTRFESGTSRNGYSESSPILQTVSKEQFQPLEDCGTKVTKQGPLTLTVEGFGKSHGGNLQIIRGNSSDRGLLSSDTQFPATARAGWLLQDQSLGGQCLCATGSASAATTVNASGVRQYAQ